MLRVRRARPEDVVQLASQLSKADLEEIAALTAEMPERVLTECLRSSGHAYAAESDASRIVALFGVAPDSKHRGVGQIWMVSSEELKSLPVTVARTSRYWVEQFQRHYTVLWNYVDVRNRTSLRWLQWCGFTIVQRVEEFGAQGLPFYEFRRERIRQNSAP